MAFRRGPVLQPRNISTSGLSNLCLDILPRGKVEQNRTGIFWSHVSILVLFLDFTEIKIGILRHRLAAVALFIVEKSKLRILVELKLKIRSIWFSRVNSLVLLFIFSAKIDCWRRFPKILYFITLMKTLVYEFISLKKVMKTLLGRKTFRLNSIQPFTAQ